MALGQKLQLNQSQQLAMTQQLQQSLQLLQMSNMELNAHIEQELEQNPLLERDDGQNDVQEYSAEDSQAAEQSDAPEERNERDLEAVWEGRTDEPFERREASADGNLHIMDFSSGAANGDNSFIFEQYQGNEQPLLQDHLLDQMTLDLPETQQRIAIHLIDLVDDAGYFTHDVAEVAERLGCEADEVEDVLSLLKRCDPVGIFAKDLSECLALQLAERHQLDPAMEVALNYLNLVADNNVKQIARLCRINVEDAESICADIKALNPKPGAEFTREAAQAITPDMFVYRNGDGEWQVELNNETLPRVLVNNHYYTDIKKRTKEADGKHFLTEQYQSASWLVRALNQRAGTMLKTARAILQKQQAFFDEGIYHLKPMIMKDVAEEIEMHESTVARVTNNKYMATPRGVFELKYFFSSAISGAGGDDDFSSHAVKQIIKDVIEAETVEKILSDDAISTILKEKGMNIARRTVAKYREAMHIPSSAQRKRQKRH